MQFHLYEDCDLKAYEAIKPIDIMNAAIPLELTYLLTKQALYP